MRNRRCSTVTHSFMLDRRQFLLSTAAMSAAAACSSSPEPAPAEATPDAASATEDLWGGPVIDIHAHLRDDVDANAVHLDGCGVSNAILLTRETAVDLVKETIAKRPQRYVWSARADVTSPDAADQLRKLVVEDGAIAFGELKADVAADGPELQRLYALAAELDVPILIHFQEFPHYDGETNYAVGIKKFAAMLEKYPNTKFVGHADAFWANVSADYENQEAYPSGPIVRGGITDKLLADYPNMFGDMSANSGNNALSRDPEFTADFLSRHQDKLMFGSDCACADGKGEGRSQRNNPAAARLFNKCVARETLTVLKNAASDDVFRKLTCENARRVYKIA
jgi:predicted TIM-barrel fold metal-dependent hydrolase